MPMGKRGRPSKPKAVREKEKREKEKLSILEIKDPMRMTKAELIKRLEDLEGQNEKLRNSAFCYLCGKSKPKTEFYTSTDIMCKSGVTPICKDCGKAIGRRRDSGGYDHSPTKKSVQLALFYMNKPFLDRVWDASVDECNNRNNASGKRPENYDVYASYMKNIAMPQYTGWTWKNSDIFRERAVYEDEKTVEGLLEGREDQDTYVDFIKNKNDVKRLLSYDPFEKESLDDQPFLYSQLLGLLDTGDEDNEDILRTSSCITIVRGMLQISKIDDAIARLMDDVKSFEKNSSTIKSLQDSKAKITSQVATLAEQSKISLKANRGAKRGSGTWTGRLKKLRDVNIRESAINGFDIATCKGMQQVANVSMAAIIDKLHLDESEWADMVAEQRKMVVEANNKANAYAEAVRILLKENIDLRDTLKSNNLFKEDELLDLDEVVNTYIESDGTDIQQKDEVVPDA